MVRLYVIGTGDIYVSSKSISCIEPASNSAAWHGVRSIVRLFDGRVLEVSENPEQVLAAMREGE